MRYLLSIFLLSLGCSAGAAELSYVCNPEQGCVSEIGPTHDIGRGVTITLPDGWTFFSYPQAPIPIMAGLREIRAFKDGIVVAITPVPNVDRRDVIESRLCELLTRSTAPYVNQSKEGVANIISMSRNDIVGCYSSYTAMNDGEKPFNVLPHRQYSSVTTLIFSHKFVIFSVSVASERAPDADYTAAVNAFVDVQ